MKKVILLVLLLVPALAFARFEKLVSDIDDMFARFSGYVVSVEDSTLITDLGRGKGVYPGMTLKIYRQNEPIIHPVTKQVLGNKKIFIGDIEISDVEEGYSTAKITNLARSVKPGDIVTMNPPVDVNIEIEKVPVRLEKLLREDLSTARNILIKDKADLLVKFIQEDDGGIRYTVSEKSQGTTIYSRYFSDEDINGGVGSIATKDILRSKDIKNTYKSMTVGRAKNDGKIYIAAATRKTVDFYIFTGSGFEEAGSIEDGFDNIQNIEMADVDGDGVDEIFISEVKYDTVVRSSIYEFDGSGFKAVEKDMLYIFRSVFVKGEKKIVAQKIAASGSYLGQVHTMVYVNGKYERGGAVSSGSEINVYGFGYSDIDEDGTNEVFHIDSENKMRVYNGNAAKYVSVEEYGQTPYFFVLKNEVIDEMEVASVLTKYQESDSDPFTYESIKKYIKGRVFVNSEGNIYVVQNDEKYKMLVNTKMYSSSRFAVLKWDGRMLRNLWKSEIFEPVIVDYYMYEELGRTYLFMLRNFSTGILADDSSQFIYIETK